MQIIFLLSILLALESLAGMTLGDLQSQKEAGFLKKCSDANEIIMIKTVRSKFNNSKTGLRKCLGNSSLKLKAPCYVVEESKCIQGQCRAISKGYDLRKLGVDLTSHWYLEQSPIYLIWGKKKQFNWQDTVWIVNEKSIISHCK